MKTKAKKGVVFLTNNGTVVVQPEEERSTTIRQLHRRIVSQATPSVDKSHADAASPLFSQQFEVESEFGGGLLGE